MYRRPLRRGGSSARPNCMECLVVGPLGIACWAGASQGISLFCLVATSQQVDGGQAMRLVGLRRRSYSGVIMDFRLRRTHVCWLSNGLVSQAGAKMYIARTASRRCCSQLLCILSVASSLLRGMHSPFLLTDRSGISCHSGARRLQLSCQVDHHPLLPPADRPNNVGYEVRRLRRLPGELRLITRLSRSLRTASPRTVFGRVALSCGRRSQGARHPCVGSCWQYASCLCP